MTAAQPVPKAKILDSPVRIPYQLQYQGSPDQRCNKIRIDHVSGQERKQISMYNRMAAWTEGTSIF